MKILNKKGNETFQLVMVIIALIFLIWGIFVVIQMNKPAKDVSKTVTSCGGIAQNIGSGVCRTDCDSSFEASYGTLGCPKEGDVQLVCCISQSSSNSDNYGGNREFNFDIKGIDLNSRSCKSVNSATNKYSCAKGSSVDINIKIFNKGTKDLSINSYPIVYLSNVQQKINKGSSESVPPSKTSTEYKNITFRLTLSETGDYVIYPAAICETAECKKTDTARNEGVYRLAKNYDLWIISE